MTDQHDFIATLHKEIEDGIDLLEKLQEGIGGLMQDLDHIQLTICAKEYCSLGCENDEHCHNSEHLKKSLKEHRYCCEPIEPIESVKPSTEAVLTPSDKA